MSKSRRQHLRFDAFIPVRYRDGHGSAAGHLTNISLGGAFLCTSEPPGRDAQLSLELLYPSADNPIRVDGGVVSVVTPEYAQVEGIEAGAGLEFGPLDLATRGRLIECIRALCGVYAGKVLLVDGRAESSRQIAHLLRQLRFSVVTTTSAHRALEVLSRDPFDLILSSTSLPDSSGLELREMILRREPDAGHTAFALISATEAEEEPQRSSELGVRGYLRHPITPDSITRLILGIAQQKSGGGVDDGSVGVVRDSETAYLRLMLLGADPRLIEGGERVIADFGLGDSSVLDMFSEEVIERVRLVNRGSNVVELIEPPILRALPALSLDEIADALTLQQQIHASYESHRQLQARGVELLGRLGLQPEFERDHFRVVATLQVGADRVTFSFRDPTTAVLVSLNERSFDGDLAVAARSILLGHVQSEVDLETAISDVLSRNRKHLEAALEDEAREPTPIISKHDLDDDQFLTEDSVDEGVDRDDSVRDELFAAAPPVQGTADPAGAPSGPPSGVTPAQPPQLSDSSGRADFVVSAKEFLPGGSEFDKRFSDLGSDLEIDEETRGVAPVEQQDLSSSVDVELTREEFEREAAGAQQIAMDTDGGALEAELQVKDFLLAGAQELEEGESLELATDGDDTSLGDRHVCSNCGEPYDAGADPSDARLLTFCPSCVGSS